MSNNKINIKILNPKNKNQFNNMQFLNKQKKLKILMDFNNKEIKKEMHQKLVLREKTAKQLLGK